MTHRKVSSFPIVSFLVIVSPVFGQIDESDSSSAWAIATPPDAVVKAYDYTGLDGLRGVSDEAAADIATLDTVFGDNTPFLSAQIIDRPIWKVKQPNTTFELNKWQKYFVENQLPKDLEIWLDAESGHLLKVVSYCDDPDFVFPDEPPDDHATSVMKSRREVYLGFPDQAPEISFQEALESAYASNPLEAKELIAVYVNWTWHGHPSKLVWCITGRGIPSEDDRGYPYGENGTMLTRMRTIVDAATGKPLGATKSPMVHWIYDD